MRSLRIILLAALATTVAAAPGTAAPWRSWSLYKGRAAVEGGTGTHSARLTSIVLPESFKVRKRATSLTFGAFASCRSTGVLSPKLLAAASRGPGARDPRRGARAAARRRHDVRLRHALVGGLPRREVPGRRAQGHLGPPDAAGGDVGRRGG